jgi:hypothetical protein
MQNYLVELGAIPAEELGGTGGHVLVRRPVEAVTPNIVLLRDAPIDGIGGRRRGQGVEERGVEHSDVRDIGKHFPGHLDADHVRRIV